MKKIFYTTPIVLATSTILLSTISCGGNSTHIDNSNIQTLNSDFSNEISEYSKVNKIYPRSNWDDFYNKENLIFQGDELPEINAVVYETKYINFAFDNDLLIPEKIAKEIIQKFYEEVDYGFGLATMDTILVTKKTVKGAAAGWGGADKDIIISTSGNYYSEHVNLDENELYPDSNNILQLIIDLMKHEYGHHETLQSVQLVGGEDIAAKALVDNKMPNYKVLDANINNDQDLLTQYTSEMKNNLIDDLGSNVVNDGQQYADGIPRTTENSWLFTNLYSAEAFKRVKVNGIDKITDIDQTFKLPYTYLYAEVFTRMMNIIEEQAYSRPEFLIDSLRLTTDVPALYYSDETHSQMLLDPRTGLFDQTNTNHVIELWKDFIYGYDIDKLYIDKDKIAGYTNKKIDFAKIKVGKNGEQTEVVPLLMTPSHFITERKSISDVPKWDTSHTAFYGKIRSKNAYFPSEDEILNNEFKPTFYTDTNKNGKWDEEDQEVMNVSYEFLDLVEPK